MKKLAILWAIAVILLSGCATTQEIIKEGVKATEYDIRNVEQLREMAKNLLETWPMYSGMIAGALGEILTLELPVRAVMAMAMLDEISKQYLTQELTDYQLGFSLGLRVQIAFSVVQEAIKQLAPEVFDLLPAVL